MVNNKKKCLHLLKKYYFFKLKAGELYNEIQSYDKALDCFCQGKDFNRAIQVFLQ